MTPCPFLLGHANLAKRERVQRPHLLTALLRRLHREVRHGLLLLPQLFPQLPALLLPVPAMLGLGGGMVGVDGANSGWEGGGLTGLGRNCLILVNRGEEACKVPLASWPETTPACHSPGGSLAAGALTLLGGGGEVHWVRPPGLGFGGSPSMPLGLLLRLGPARLLLLLPALGLLLCRRPLLCRVCGAAVRHAL